MYIHLRTGALAGASLANAEFTHTGCFETT